LDDNDINIPFYDNFLVGQFNLLHSESLT
jgi:hypothetical protein